MSDEIEKVERKIAQLRTTNAGLTQEIESLGGGVEVTVARLEHFMQWICIELDIPKEKRLEEQLNWEMGLRVQLIGVRDKVKETRQAMEAELRRREKAAADAAATPKGKHTGEKQGLWTPGKN